jgi:hypothetical protein
MVASWGNAYQIACGEGKPLEPIDAGLQLTAALQNIEHLFSIVVDV